LLQSSRSWMSWVKCALDGIIVPVSAAKDQKKSAACREERGFWCCDNALCALGNCK
jgi:hypothetical protein